jgi:hypothetical protein
MTIVVAKLFYLKLMFNIVKDLFFYHTFSFLKAHSHLKLVLIKTWKH